MAMGIPHPIPYQGSKRRLADQIRRYFPDDVDRLMEPFAGSAAVSLAAAFHGAAKGFVLNDANSALMSLWTEIIEGPELLATQYSELWHEQSGRERQYYDDVRRRFNANPTSADFLYLLARCVKASVRYNANGEFNQSPDNRRRGSQPHVMRSHLLGASRLLRGRTVVLCGDCEVPLREAGHADLVYMDPPYQGVCGERDQRYIEGIAFDRFVSALDRANSDGVSYIVSYDGRTGEKQFGRLLPPDLGLVHIELEAGPSTQATLLGRYSVTVESLYLSPALVARTGERVPQRLGAASPQLSLLEPSWTASS
jgi:DNA adenine methylase